jgi:uncharacterized damage-inducible protein DinB
MAGLLKRVGLALLSLSLGAIIALAGDTAPDRDAPAPRQGFRADILGQISFVEKRIEDLAAAVPAEKYSWRPADGIRSVSEVYVHVIGTNYFFMTFLGVKPPMAMDPNMEKTLTDKSEIAAKFKPSFDFFRKAVTGLSDKDLDKTAEVFGNKMSYRNVLITAIAHLHEHLGQSIAYARMNGVVPPWTAEQQAAESGKKEMK